ALQGAVLARPAVEDIEGHVRLQIRQYGGDVAGDIGPRHPIAEPGERLSASRAGAQRDIALGRPASHQNGDVLAHAFWTLRILIRSRPNRIEIRQAVERLR